jgi:hypothetical protein
MLRLTKQQAEHTAVRTSEWWIALVAGLLLAAGYWWTLLTGGGLVGGDTYPYFFPQKQLMAEEFAKGRLPLWHDRTSYGYPLHAESQAGIFYPSNQLLYRLFDINTAYSLSIVLHYWLAYVFGWRFLRTQAASQTAALVGAMIYVYGWFPARASLEWSIIGGVWFPAALWMTDQLIRCPSRRAFAALAACLGLHLLAGHFALAFITELTCVGYAVLRLLLNRRSADSAVTTHSPGVTRRLTPVVLAVLAGLLLAAVQLIPTLELKRLSQRQGENTAFNPQYGHLPPVYLTQVLASWWYWHTPEMVQSRQMMQYPLTVAADSNPVEAHLYFGLIPLGMLVLSLNSAVRARMPSGVWMTWAVLSLFAVIYATGWLVPYMRYVPGFGFFMGPGRYTIITTMGASVIVALTADALLTRRTPRMKKFILLMIAAVTFPDLRWSSQPPVCDAVQVPDAPCSQLNESWLAKTLQQAGPHDVRLLSPGPNVANLYGISCVPQYLGLGPAEYYVDQTTYRTQPEPGDTSEFPSPDEVQRLRDRGVTHLLATEPIISLSPEMELVASAPDSFLNAVWGRGGSDCFLYRFKDLPQRVFSPTADALTSWEWLQHDPGKILLQVHLSQRAVIGLRELMYPGWEVAVDGQPAVPTQSDGFSRMVEVPTGEHTIQWVYRPRSVLAGGIISLSTTVLLLGLIWKKNVAAA